jgi:hypothetical protein
VTAQRSIRVIDRAFSERLINRLTGIDLQKQQIVSSVTRVLALVTYPEWGSIERVEWVSAPGVSWELRWSANNGLAAFCYRCPSDVDRNRPIYHSIDNEFKDESLVPKMRASLPALFKKMAKEVPTIRKSWQPYLEAAR